MDRLGHGITGSRDHGVGTRECMQHGECDLVLGTLPSGVVPANVDEEEQVIKYRVQSTLPFVPQQRPAPSKRARGNLEFTNL